MTHKNSSPPDVERLCEQVSPQLNVNPEQVRQAVQLLQQSRTIPFIARYRKESTGGLNEQQLRVIEDALGDARKLEERRATILRALVEREIPDAVMEAIRACGSRAKLEQLYHPWRSRRRTRADTAREQGLEPLARLLLKQSVTGSRSAILRPFVQPDREVPDEAAALAGACDIVTEQWAAQSRLQSWMLERAGYGKLRSRVKRGRQDDQSPFADYFDHSEPISRAASHRILAMLRGAKEGVLNVSIQLDEDWILPRLQRRLISNRQFTFADELHGAVLDCYRRLLRPATQSVILQQLRERAERDSIDVFAANLSEMLMAPPAGPRPAIGIDPGFRTGCKVAVVDATGRCVASDTIYPTPPRSDQKGAGKRLLQLIEQYHIELIAIGNGTASRETQRFVGDVLADHSLDVVCAMVSEAGASIYSASEQAVEEYPEFDVTIRGAISIAHRIQDPLAELVKLDPATIGAGQYQHDVDQQELRRVLTRQAESCVSQVGVDLNTASRPLLARVPGIGSALAGRIVEYRDEHGRFQSRRELLNVPSLGPVAFEQASGFLRIRDGDHVLDNSAVHPESYSVVQEMADRAGRSVRQLVEDPGCLDTIDPQEFVSSETGEQTVIDILAELRQPGRDPRAEFRTVRFDDRVREIADVAVGMQLEGVVTNVTGFGAFVDIGVHQDALLHISQMADHFVKDATQEVSVGEILSVRVTDVDVQRKRISLSRRTESAASSQ